VRGVRPLTLDDAELDEIARGGVVLRDGAAPDALVDRWAADVLAAELTPAGVGARGQIAPEVRSDRTAFVTADDPRWAELVAWFDALRGPLSEGLRLALPASSVQIAVYGPGDRYAAHVDAIRGEPTRRITAILYLDRTWTLQDGGALRVHTPEGPRDIAPIGGRLVLFRADAVQHEVLAPTRPRPAAAAWFGAVR
jgi:SM-20-related protein